MIYTVEKIVRKEKLLVTNNFSFLDELILKISFYDSMWNSVHQGTEPKYDPKGIILILFIKGH